MFGRKKDLRDRVPVKRAPEAEAAPEPAAPPTAPGSGASFAGSHAAFWVEGVSLRGIPILLTIAMAIAIPFFSQTFVFLAESVVLLPGQLRYEWATLFYQYVLQLLVTLIVINQIRRTTPADYGVHAPAGKSYAGAALLWGVVFGGVMAAVDWWPSIMSHIAPEGPYVPDTLNIVGWLALAVIAIGPADEVLFRGLLTNYLFARIPGRVGFRSFSLGAGGLVASVLFALAYAGHFLTLVWFVALGQIAYGLAFGIFLAYWLEKSRSVAAPIIAESVAQLVKYALIFAMVAAWR